MSGGDSTSEGTHVQAAEVALLVMRTSIKELAARPQYLLLPSRTPLSPDEIVRQLVSQPKPVACEARASEGLIAITCDALHESRLRERQGALAAQRWSFWDEKLRSRWVSQDCVASLLLRNDMESLQVSLDAFRVWMRDYKIPHTLAMENRPPPSGVCAVIFVSPPPTATLEVEDRDAP